MEELDLPPEFCRYQDEGCELSKSCLNCPLPKCILELAGGRQHWLKTQRNQEIARVFFIEGKRVKDLAQSFGLSTRTVQRVLKSCLTAPSYRLPSQFKEREQR